MLTVIQHINEETMAELLDLVVLSLTTDILHHIVQLSLKKYKSHINIEACASVKSVKYLFKYVYKGHNCANMEMIVDQVYYREGEKPAAAERASTLEILKILTLLHDLS